MVSAGWLVAIAVVCGCGGLLMGAVLMASHEERDDFAEFEAMRKERQQKTGN